MQRGGGTCEACKDEGWWVEIGRERLPSSADKVCVLAIYDLIATAMLKLELGQTTHQFWQILNFESSIVYRYA